MLGYVYSTNVKPSLQKKYEHILKGEIMFPSKICTPWHDWIQYEGPYAGKIGNQKQP